MTPFPSSTNRATTPPIGRLLAACLAATLAFAVTAADTFDAPGNFNPIVPGYFADPTIKRFGTLFYLYATTDGNGGGRGPATVWVSQDFVRWVLVPMNWPTTPHYWAPDVVRRPDGRYYLFYNQPCSTFAGVSETPVGPWTPITPGDGLVIRDRLVKDVITLDTQFFEDKDGTLYGHWGTWGIFANSGCGFGVFNPDMKSFARLGMIPNTQAKDFFEAPFMIERNGVYYFTYSSGSCHDASYRVQYATSDKPDGVFTMGPNNPILATTADATVHGPGHHSILHLGDHDFIVYHRHDIPVTPNGMHRQTCADRLVFAADGIIEKVVPTHRGIGPLGPQAREPNLAFTKTVTASSRYTDTLRHHTYKPEYGVDDNNATLWRPADNRMGHWLAVDLGSPQRVRRTEIQFEYGTWSYQYLIETSLDGQVWTPFADRRQNTRWGSPMVDEGDVDTRYLRLTITGTEFPGLFGAVWNFKAYADAPPDPLLALADQAFEDAVAPKKTGQGERASFASAESKAAAVMGGEAHSPTPSPLIHLDVSDLQLGATVAAWTNHGTLGGTFASRDTPPSVSLASGRKAVRFAGKELLAASFPAPTALAGNSSFTVTAWLNNPEIAESECFLSWAGRGGPDATTAQFGHGTQPEFGAVGHWGFADLGFRGGPPQAGQWYHIAVVFDGLIERVYVNGQLNNAEAKMLLMHAGRPVYVGASEPGTEHFDGYIASLRVYAAALSEAEVKALAADVPSADVLVHVESARLDDGPLASWSNHGSLGGAFAADGPPPIVGDLQGRLAVGLTPAQSLTLALDDTTRLADLTLLVSLATPAAGSEPRAALEFEGADATRTLVPLEVPAADWHFVAIVFQRRQDSRILDGAIAPPASEQLETTRDGTGTRYLDGEAVPGPVALPPECVRSIRLVGQSPAGAAVSGLQVIRRALSAGEIRTLAALARQERRSPSPNPAAFDQSPAALDPTVVVMTAVPGQSAAGRVEYSFTETTGHPGGSSSGWTPHPVFLDDALAANTRYAYTIRLRDALGNVTAAAAPLDAVTDTTRFRSLSDPFATNRDFLVQGVSGTIWDGFLGPADQSAPEAILAQGGVLRLQSKGTVWDGGAPRGVFLYKTVPAEFVAQVHVADYAGLATRRVPGNNDGGLMVRSPKLADAGPGEDLLQLNFFPIWNQGNMVTILNGGRRQKGNGLAWNAHRHLQIIRRGPLFWFRTSPDGARWQDLPGSPVERTEMARQPLQVGLYHASYGSESSFITFSNFTLTLP